MGYVAQNDQPGWLARLLGNRTRRAASLLAALVVAAVLSQPALGQGLREPTDAELRTAYCISYLNQQIPWVQSLLTEAQRAVTSATGEDVEKRREAERLQAEVTRQQTSLRRLQSYLIPKLKALDPSAIALANQRGVEDFKEIKTQTFKGNPDHIKELYKRTNACLEPDWLPF
jgi:hypothetical protein